MIKKASMKKFVIFVMVFCCILISQNTIFAAQTLSFNYDGKTVKYSGITYKINIDNKEVKSDFPGIVFNKVTMFPLRAVFEKLGGTVVWNSKTQLMDITYNGTKLQFKNNDVNAKINGKNIKLSAPAKKINDRLIVPVDFLKNMKDLSAVIDSKTKAININITAIGSVKEVSSVISGEKDIVTLKTSYDKGYTVSRLTNPNRIVVDFKNVKSSAEVKTINGKRVSGISISPLPSDKNSTRIEITLKEMDKYSIAAIAGGCKITIEKPVNAKYTYVNNQDRIYFSLIGINLASVGSTITNHFKEEYDVKNNKYIMTIPASSTISLADETININDSNISTIEIFRDEKTSDTKIVFNTKKEIKFYTSYNDTRKQTEINLLTPAKKDERLVVIDAGHGGQDPGAIGKTANEKSLNLAIALKLEDLLKKQNVKTFMLRQDDTFVGLYDRPYIANALNATLFLSIHNNSIDNSKVSGTETLYYPEKDGDKSFTGEKFAKSIQDLLISNLKTVNRKTVERPGLVVLKYTKMPSALAEIGFLTNAGELKNLSSESFQQKTAKALCDAILAALKKIEIEKKASAAIESKKSINDNIEMEKEASADIESKKSTSDNVEVEKEASTASDSQGE